MPAIFLFLAGVFRVDVLKPSTNYSVFYKVNVITYYKKVDVTYFSPVYLAACPFKHLLSGYFW